MGLFLMSKKYNIVHVSQTPLVAAPSKIAAAQRIVGHNAVAIAINDYPGNLKGMFIDDYMTDTPFSKPIIERLIKSADIIQIHNDLPKAWVEYLIEINQRADYIYQVHSPLREGPLYIPRDEFIGIPFSAKFVVGQFQPRIHTDYIIVPNIILEPPSLNLRKQGEKLRVVFSPTHLRPGRWNNKYVEELDVAIKSLCALGKIEIIMPSEPVHPKILMAARRTCHVSIDEIATGGFHQVSLEGLAAGNIVINRADYFSKVAFSKFTEGKIPPFLYADKMTIGEVLTQLVDDVELTNSLQFASYDYFSKYLIPTKMAKVFDDAYELL